MSPAPTSALAPIALFTYRRPAHLARTLDALRCNPEARGTPLYVFSDGSRNDAASEGVGHVRKMLRELDGFGALHVECREGNSGLARNITAGIADVLSLHDRVVVVEDDLVVSPYFLKFMNEALSYYCDEPRIGSISGYCYPVSCRVPETYFIRGADCWGWATWRDRWKCFNPDGQALLEELERQGLGNAFDFDGAMSFSAMLKDQVAGRNDSWAVRWHASCFLRDLLILYPGRSLAQNIGHDGTGTHGTEADESYRVDLSRTPVTVGGIPIEENAAARRAISDFFLKGKAPAPRSKAWRERLVQITTGMRRALAP